MAYLPALQTPVAAVRPVVAQKDPVGQLVQAEADEDAEKVPVRQEVPEVRAEEVEKKIRSAPL